MRVLVLILALSACSGTMQGVTRGTGEAVKFSYEQGMNSDTLTAVVGTETFKGKAVPRGRQSIRSAKVGSRRSRIHQCNREIGGP